MLSVRAASTKGVAVAITHGLAGWGLCGVTMSVGIKMTTIETALTLHALAVPMTFTALSLVYFHRLFSSLRVMARLHTAAAFLGVVVAMDFFVVALFIERSFKMFESILGTWLPFLLIFISTW